MAARVREKLGGAFTHLALASMQFPTTPGADTRGTMCVPRQKPVIVRTLRFIACECFRYQRDSEECRFRFSRCAFPISRQMIVRSFQPYCQSVSEGELNAARGASPWDRLFRSPVG
jgi:hypothetical protein